MRRNTHTHQAKKKKKTRPAVHETVTIGDREMKDQPAANTAVHAAQVGAILEQHRQPHKLYATDGSYLQLEVFPHGVLFR